MIAMEPPGQHVAVFDILHESQYLSACNEVVTGQPKRFAELLTGPPIKIAYRPVVFRMVDGEENVPEFEPFVKLCYLKGKMTMVVDEAHNLCSPNYMPDAFLDAVRLGRHRELNITYIGQSWAGIARPLTAATDEYYFFKIIEPRDLEGIRQRCGDEVMERVKNLRRLDYTKEGIPIPGEILHWSSYEGVIENEDNTL